MDFIENKHIWTPMFFQRGSLAFWFCSCCGETDRDTSCLSESLDKGVEAPELTVSTDEPPVPKRKWNLLDGSVLLEDEPCSTRFMGESIPGLSFAHDYKLVDGSGSILRKYTASRERASKRDDSFLITRYQVEGENLIKYRIHCTGSKQGEDLEIGEAVGIAILSDLQPVPECCQSN